ncbi:MULTISPECIES: patatin-like phospholipase family protein [Legionella]|uniref:Patatin-like phospholipase n=1 Tax=Legionella drozanskii LLAP-1 TaxID=1212489 RepID=A0A0W0SXN0_9GAMM|nr:MULTISPECIES: patatin-like phospholipase family protein [Legionella]KTC87701.1 patatin-like phospholipase [Legionella drozanskii LLAP-1]PJE16235.1 MAG: patatin [Legionella sp.]
MTIKHQKNFIKRICLVLQGGGSLGVFQAGVFEGLVEYGFTPNWIGGTSIGSINAAIIAGNKPQERLPKLKQFWQTIAQKDLFNIESSMPDPLRKIYSHWYINTALFFGIPQFFTPVVPMFFTPFMAEQIDSFYDLTPLSNLLQELIDFDYLNKGKIRVSLGATNVITGEIDYFDSRCGKIRLEHVIASSALPPAFPPIKVNDSYYWDGGIYSNTPLDVVLDDSPRVNTLCFMVDLWERKGYLPKSLDEVVLRQEDIKFASRSEERRRNYLEKHNLRRIISTFYKQLPKHLQDLPSYKAMALLGCTTHMDIVQLTYRPKKWEVSKKVVDFSESTMRERWIQGYQEAVRACKQAEWSKAKHQDTGVNLFILPPITDGQDSGL